MKYLFFLVALIFAACQPVVVDTPELRSAIEAKFGATVAPDSGNVGMIRITLLTPPPMPTIDDPVLPTVTPTPECVNAKANISASGERIYHMPGQANYNTVKIDKDGEAIYCTEQEAIDAGFRKAQR